MDNAMLYEIIVRFANGNCGRFGVAGANADIYRSFTMSEAIYEQAQAGNNNVSDSALKYGIALGEVSAYLSDSAERIKRIYADVLTEEQLNTLQNSNLAEPTSEKIDDIIEQLSELIQDLRNRP